MLKKGKKVLLLILAFALVLAMLAGCSGGWTGAQVKYDEANGGKGGAVSSNGGFVVQKGEGDNAWFYFINGVQDSSADNTYGDVVKGSLMRISAGNMKSGSYENAETVVPELFVAGDYTAGVYIYGDSVYYATPNTIRNLDGEVESGYLNFRSANLDGSAMTDYYVQVSSNTTEYRFVEENGVVYLLYLDSTNTEIHSYNTQTGVNTVLAKGYTSAEFDDSDPENPVVYYTMPVTTPGSYSASSGSGSPESYNQLYRVTASATTGPLADIEQSEAFIAAYTDDRADENDEDRTMEYVNLGTLVLDGIGKYSAVQPSFITPFNLDFEKVTIDDIIPIRGFTYAILRYANGQVILSIADGVETQAYALEDSTVAEASEWDSIAANPEFDGASGELSAIARTTTNITSSTFFYKDADGAQYYIYVDESGNICRVKVGATAAEGYVEEFTTLAYAQSGAAVVFVEPIVGSEKAFLYYSMSGTNGNSLYRIQYNGAADDYNPLGAAYENADFRPTQYLAIDYNSSWYKPESVGGYLFFASAEDYSENYVFAMADPATNEELETINEQYETVNDLFTEMDTDFGDAANLARYYYYGGDLSPVRDEEGDHFEQYQAEDFEVLDAFIACAAPGEEGYNTHGFDFSVMKSASGDAEAVYNTRNAFYKLLGKVSDDDAETVEDNLIANLVLSEAEDETSDAWTWQWAAIFVPVGVVVIAGVVVAVVLVRRKKRK